MFKSIFGRHNLCGLGEDNAEVWWTYFQAAINRRLEVSGQFSVTVSLSPWGVQEKAFFVEGFGRYFVHGAPEGEDLVASADFHIYGGKLYHTDEVGDAIDIFVEQQLVREFSPGVPRFAHSSVLVINTRLKAVGKGMFSIRYDTGHPIGVEVQPDESPNVALNQKTNVTVEPVGCVWFQAPNDGRKLVDLDGLDWVKNDYDDDLYRAGFKPESTTVKAQWASKPACETRSRPPSTPITLPWTVQELRKMFRCDLVKDQLSQVQAPRTAGTGTGPTPTPPPTSTTTASPRPTPAASGTSTPKPRTSGGPPKAAASASPADPY